MKTKVRASHGFTLIELVVVILVLSVLAVSVVPKLSGTSDYQDITHRDNVVSLLRTVQQRAMQNTQGTTCHRVRFQANVIGLSAQKSDETCDTGVITTNGTNDFLVLTGIDSYTAQNSATSAITYIDFNELGQPSVNTGTCNSNCQVNIGSQYVCIESQGYIHVCSP